MKPNWFIALPVDPGDWLRPLLRSAPKSLRLFHPEDVHITVAFLGSCGEARARRSWATVEGCDAAPMNITLGTLKALGNPRRPSALGVVIAEGSEPVARLIGTLRGPAWAAAEARPDDRPPLPHITVARPPRRASSHERQAAVDWALGQPSIGARVTIDRLVLMTWATDRRIRQFQEVAQLRLTGAPQRAADDDTHHGDQP